MRGVVLTDKSSDVAAGHLVGQDVDWAEISDTLYGRGFQETSWSQDITASFAYGSARIFIHPANREDREDSSEGSRRFFVTEDTTSFEFATDDLHEAMGVAIEKTPCTESLLAKSGLTLGELEYVIEAVVRDVYQLSAYAKDTRMGDKQKLTTLCKLIAKLEASLKGF